MNKINNIKTQMICFASILAIQVTNALPDFSQMANRSVNYMTNVADATVGNLKDYAQYNFPRTHKIIAATQKFVENTNLEEKLKPAFESTCPNLYKAFNIAQGIIQNAGEDSIKDCLIKNFQSQYPGLFNGIVSFQQFVQDIKPENSNLNSLEGTKNVAKEPDPETIPEITEMDCLAMSTNRTLNLTNDIDDDSEALSFTPDDYDWKNMISDDSDWKKVGSTWDSDTASTVSDIDDDWQNIDFDDDSDWEAL